VGDQKDHLRDKLFYSDYPILNILGVRKNEVTKREMQEL